MSAWMKSTGDERLKIPVRTNMLGNFMKILNTTRTAERKLYVLLITLFVLVVTDGVITSLLITNGIAWEGNPLLQGWVEQWYFPLVKALGALFCAVVIWDIYQRWPKLAILSSISFVIFYGLIVLWNSFLLLTGII
jgi:O-antigen ligase